MAIYIKGLDMPTNCTDCRYKLFAGCNPYQDNGLSPNDHRHRTCPLTEVLEPHGRLIDADVLLEAIRTDIMGGLNYESFIREAPTIIERSKSMIRRCLRWG